MGRYLAYTEYKNSGIKWLGKIPAHWDTSRLRFLLLTNPTKSEIQLQPNDYVSFIPMEAVGEYGGLTLDTEKTYEDIGSGYTYFRDEDVVVAKITPCFENGKGAVAEKLSNCIAFGTTELHVLRTLKNLDRNFLFYLTISHPFRKLGESEMYGAGGQKRVPESFIRDLRPGIPPLPEQQQIAAFLDYKTAQIDALIAKKEALLEKLAEKRTALISQAVTKGLDPTVPMKDSGIEWLGEIPEHWKLGVKLIYLAETKQHSFVNGPFGSDLLTSELTDSGIPVIYSGDVKPGRFRRKSDKYVTEEKAYQLNFCRVDPGDLLLAKVGDPPGDAAIYSQDNDPGIVTQDVVRIKVDQKLAIPEYLVLLLNSQAGRHIIRLISVEATRSRFSLGDFKGIRVFLPPLEEQQKIINEMTPLLRVLDKQEEKVLEAIKKLKEYRTALITNAVTGKIDVRDIKLSQPNSSEAA